MNTDRRVGAAVAPPEHDFTGDPYWGRGGSYVVDPATGRRTPAPAVDEASADIPVPVPAAERAPPAASSPDRFSGTEPEADPEKNLKEKRRG